MGGTMVWLVICVHFLFAAASFARNDEMIVYPKMLESRSEGGPKVLKISEDITLNLEKSTIFPDEFFVHSRLDGTPIAYHMKGKEAEKNLYHDIKHMASVDVSHEDGLRIEGTLGHTLRIKPMPEERSLDGLVAHLLYNADEPPSAPAGYSDHDIPPQNNASSIYVQSRKLNSAERKHHRRLPRIIYPEVFVVTDLIISSALNYDPRIVARYIAIMGNSANLRYLSMRQPRVQLRIVGIAVTNTKDEEPYMAPVPGYENTKNILNMKTLGNFNEHVKTKPYFSKSDIVFLLTGRNISSIENGVLKAGQGGRAYMGGVCTEWKVGMSEERVGSFYGVYVFAHEIAHSLGCDHDEWGPDRWPAGVIGSKDCPWDDGYMMSYKFKVPNLYSFSRCCQREVLNLLNRPDYKCLREINYLKTVLHSSRLPGEVSSRDTYCRKVYHQYRYVEVDREYPEHLCTVKCYIDKRKYDNMLITAVDGVKCGRKKYCALGQCLTKEQINKLE